MNPSPSTGASAATPPLPPSPQDLGPFASRHAASLQRQVVHLSRRKTLFPASHGSVKGGERRRGNFEEKKMQGALNGFRQCFRLLSLHFSCALCINTNRNSRRLYQIITFHHCCSDNTHKQRNNRAELSLA